MHSNPIQSLWIGKELSIIEKLSIESFLQNGHEFHLYVYGDVRNIPKHTLILDANDICPFDPSIVIDEGFGAGSLAPFSDYFRFNLLFNRGGWWVDLDVICIQNFSNFNEEVIASSLEIPEGDCANCNVLRFPKGHWFAKEFLNQWERQWNIRKHYALGVQLVKELVNIHNKFDILVPHEVFNPISWRHVRYLTEKPEPWFSPIGIKRLMGFNEKVGKITNETRAIHFWNEGWKKAGLDRDRKYSNQSIFERLKATYLSTEF